MSAEDERDVVQQSVGDAKNARRFAVFPRIFSAFFTVTRCYGDRKFTRRISKFSVFMASLVVGLVLTGTTRHLVD